MHIMYLDDKGIKKGESSDMLFTREKKILMLLMDQEDKLTTTQIAAMLKVSSRTIKTDIKKINEEVQSQGCRINSKQGVGVWIEYDNQQAERCLKEIVNDEDDSYLSPEIRKYHLAVELLFQDEYTSMEVLAGKYFVSKATVWNDLSELDQFWNQFNIKFVKKVKFGIKVEGAESQIRSALIEALKRVGGKQEVNVQNIQQYFINIDFNQLRKIIYQVERRFQFVLTDTSIEELLIALAVMIKRISQGKVINSNDSIAQKDYRRMNFVLIYLKNCLVEMINFEIPDEEDIYLKICMNGLRFQIPMKQENSIMEKRQRNPEMFDAVVSLIMECDRKFYLNLEEDDELIGALMDHLECLILRVNSQLYTYNPIIKTIKKELFYEYEVASYFMAKFSALYMFDATEDEIGFIAFHIGTSMERMKQKYHEKVSVTIVCTTGFGTSQFIRVKLASYFPNLEIKETLSVTRLSQIKAEDQDFVITTVPIELDNITVIQISPVLKENDIKKIQRFLLNRKENKLVSQKKYENLKKFLHSEISILRCDLKTREEVINLLGSRMVSEGYTDKEFIESVFERERLSETAIGNLIAVPHAHEGHIKKQGIGIMTLKKPIDWGDEKVQIVFMLSLDATSKDYIKEIFNDVFELTKDNKTVESIIKAQKYTEIIK